MPRKATGSLVVREGVRGVSYAARVRWAGRRYFVTLGYERDGMTELVAREEFERIRAAIKLGIWKPPQPEPVIEMSREVPTLFSSQWHAGRKGIVRPRTSEWERWALSGHLLPVLSARRVDEIDAGVVRAMVASMQTEGTLSARSINSTLRVLSLVMAAAVEDGYLEANPITRARFVKAARPARGWLEPDELADLLDACTDKSRALVATMALAGLRVSEAAGLRWRSVDLASGRLTIESSKTDTGRRVVSDLNPELIELLKVHRMGSRRTGPDDLVFGTATGREKSRSSIGRQVLKPALERANEARAKVGRPPIARATAHDLRRTFAALCFAAGASPAAVMQALGHTSAALSLEVYAKVVAGSTHGLGESMARLVRGPDWAPSGTNDAQAEGGLDAAAIPVRKETAV
jgi:integrase